MNPNEEKVNILPFYNQEEFSNTLAKLYHKRHDIYDIHRNNIKK